MRSRRLHIASLWNGQPAAASERVLVTVDVTPNDLKMQVDAPFFDDPMPPGPPGSTDGLWNYEVVELFVAGTGTAYLELELGPHGHYLALRFSGPRMRCGGPIPGKAIISHRGNRWVGSLAIETSALRFEPTRANAYAIHGAGDARRHLAAHAPGGKLPDFHRIESFVSIL